MDMMTAKAKTEQMGLTWKGDFFDSLGDDERNAGYIKFNIPNPETPHDLNGEGVWGWVPPEDKQKYDDDSFTGNLTVILCNDPLYYSGILLAGQEVVVRCNGDKRPILDPDWVQEHLASVDKDAEEISPTSAASSPENEWRLGEDLRTYDNLLDGITFDDLILQMHCNVPKDKMTPECVRSQLNEFLESRLDDMRFLLENNIDKIIEYSRNYYRDE